jgi:hypothetical protein
VFRGRAVTLFPPAPGRAEASWDSMIASDVAVYAKTGNDRRFVGLWAFGIPTLQDDGDPGSGRTRHASADPRHG